MKQIIGNIVTLSQYSDFVSGICLVLFGIWLGFPELSSATAPATSWLFKLAPRIIWLLMLTIAGLSQIAAVWSGGIRIRHYMARLMCGVWLGLAGGISTVSGTYASAALGMGATMFMLSLYFRIKRNQSWTQQ